MHHDTPVPRVLLLVPTTTYRAPDFVAAARALGVELVVGADDAPVLGDGDRTVAVPLDDVDGRGRTDRRARPPPRASTRWSRSTTGASWSPPRPAPRLGFPHSPPDAVAATRDKAEMRRRLAAGEVPQPRFGTDGRRGRASRCVVKPTGLSGSQGVIRVRHAGGARRAARARIAGFWAGPVIVEEYVPGRRGRARGLLRDGALEVLAVFDKPDPLEGPYFEETIYVTPSRLPAATLDGWSPPRPSAAAARSGSPRARCTPRSGSVDGHASGCIEVAARSIGGLCARTLRFGAGHQPRGGDPPPRARAAARRARARGRRGGRDDAADRARRRRSRRCAAATTRSRSTGIVGLEITVPPGPRGRAAARRRPLPRLPVRPRRDTRPRSRPRCGKRPATHRYGHHVKVLLVSTYELGHQPLAVAGPAGRLRARGHDVRCLDLVGRPVGSRRSAPGPTRSRSRCRCTPRPASPARSRRRSPARSRATACTPAMCDDVATALVSRDPDDRRSSRWIEDDADARRPRAGAARPATCSRRSSAYAHLVAGRRGAPRRVGRGVARLRAPVPPLPGAGRLRRPHPDQRRRRGASPTSPSRSRWARGTSRFGDPDFFNGVHHALPGRARGPRAVPGPDLRLHGQGRAHPAPRRRVGRDGGVGLPLRGVRVRVA